MFQSFVNYVSGGAAKEESTLSSSESDSEDITESYEQIGSEQTRYKHTHSELGWIFRGVVLNLFTPVIVKSV